LAGPEAADEMDWYQVDFDGVQGWVSRSYLALPASDDDAAAGDLATATPVATEAAI
jgi:hypothetical protein